ncbi:MAG: type II toxin-antitoxin system RelE/ParE family toxin [candidate division NC10 bacterium]|nr:type II toxin-antitoxin system RelE/ParE family toxin [candidate division NC10 bacterium]
MRSRKGGRSRYRNFLRRTSGGLTDYRIIYQVNDESAVVKVLRVMHRREVYR